MSKIILSKSTIPHPVVSTDCAVLLNNSVHKWCQACPGSIFQVPQPNTPDAFFFFVFYCNTNECFAFGTTTAFSWLFSTHIGLVDFYQTTQLISAGPYHRATKFLQPLPSSVIAAQAKNSLQSESICPIFLTSDVPHSTKPKPQGFPSAMKNSSGGDRSLRSTSNAMEKTPICSPSARFSAMRANKALRPSQCSEVFDTSGLRAKPFLKLKQVPWVIFLHKEEYYILWLLESSAYPS